MLIHAKVSDLMADRSCRATLVSVLGAVRAGVTEVRSTNGETIANTWENKSYTIPISRESARHGSTPATSQIRNSTVWIRPTRETNAHGRVSP